MHYIIQEGLFRDFHFNELKAYLERYHLSYEVVPFRPFTQEIDVQTDRKDIWCFGSNNMALAAAQKGWYPGSLYNDQHNMNVYGPKFGQHLLNHDCIYQRLGDPLPASLPFAFFARPVLDSKVFSGQSFTQDAWKEWVESIEITKTHLGTRLVNMKDLQVQLAPLKTVQQEIRCWIVDGKPVTISQYKIGNRVNFLNMDHNEEAVIFATQMAKIFAPARAFVLDICLHEDEYKVVEINCINCSGFYDGNLSKLIQALENAFVLP